MLRFQHAQTYNHSRMSAAQSAGNNAKTEGLLWKIIIVCALSYLVWDDRVSLVIGPSAVAGAGPSEMGISIFGIGKATAKPVNAVTPVILPAGKLQNTTFVIDPGYAGRNGVPMSEFGPRQSKCHDYVERFSPVAIGEMRQYGIPASIILAQGLLESDAGESDLAKATNNHFGIKCFSKNCKRGHCKNFSDDSHKDFFIAYNNAWGSFRAHSEFLKNTPRYRKIFNQHTTDYRVWAKGLVQAGYATDKSYGDKLIAVIQHLQLDRFDRGYEAP